MFQADAVSQKRLTKKFQTEIARHEKYLESLGKKIYYVRPDGDCLFRALAHATKRLDPGHLTLRLECMGHMQRNIRRFLRFMYVDGHELTEKEFTSELEEMSDEDVWVKYETVMAASLVLKRSILITSGGHDKETMKTNAFFYGDTPSSDRVVHIGYVSLGFYYSIVDAEASDSNLNMSDWLMDQPPNCHPFGHRTPSHVCDCGRACGCREFEKPWILRDNTCSPDEDEVKRGTDQRTRDVEPMLGWSWASVVDNGSTST